MVTLFQGRIAAACPRIWFRSPLGSGRQRAWARIKFFVMANPFKPDDKVITKQQGVEVEAVVRLIYNDEVQVRTPDGVLRWRTAKTVWFPKEPESPGELEAALIVTAGAVTPVAEAPVEQPAPQIEASDEEPAPELVEGAEESNAPEVESSERTEAVDPEQEEVEPQPPVQTPPLVDTRPEYGPCGVPETMAQRKRNRKGGRRR